MAFTPIWFSGFEPGSIQIVPDADRGSDAAGGDIEVNTHSHTGTYSLLLGTAHFDVDISDTQSEIYIGLWTDPDEVYTDSEDWKLLVYLTDGNNISVRINNTKFDAYVGGSKVADGTVPFENNWTHIQLYTLISNSGSIQTKVNGLDDISYSGDTQPGASSTIDYIRVQTSGISGNRNAYFDDWVIGDDGWPGDWRVDGLFPDGDTATEDWSLSTGTDSYALLDEAPPSDSDYITTTNDADQTIVTVEDWSGAGFTPQAGMIWARARKETAGSEQVKIIDSDGTNTNVGTVQDLNTSYRYYSKLKETAPDGGAWTDTDADNLQIGVEAAI